MKNSALIECGSSLSSRSIFLKLSFLFFSFGRGEIEGSKKRQNVLKFLSGNNNEMCNTSGRSEFI